MTVDPGQMVPQNPPLETSVSVAVPLPPATGAGPTLRQLRDARLCDEHGMLAGGCMYCADPVLEHEMLRAAQAVLDEGGGPW